ncbi:MAG: hypothetical protein IT305_29315, partial [Chloroflexi bacterium]|nr:hypothetical protein [Chloroflexota bacterium]
MLHSRRGEMGSRLAPLLLAAILVISLSAGTPEPLALAPAAQAAALRPKTIAPGDGAGIVAALAEAKVAGGGVIHVPAGVYLLPRKLNVPSNTTLYGDGIDRTIFRWAPGATIEDMVRNDSTNGNTNVQIRSLTLDGEDIQPGPGASSSGIRLGVPQDIASSTLRRGRAPMGRTDWDAEEARWAEQIEAVVGGMR